MNGFVKKSVGTLTLGEKLKKIRSEKRISLAEISRSTRIQVKYLEFLEEGLYDKLPADVYVRGFLKNYADFFAINENVLLRLYEKEKGIKKNLEKSNSNGKEKKLFQPINVSAFVVTPKMLVSFFFVLLALSGFIYLYSEVGSFASTPRLVVLSPENNAKINGNSLTVEGVTDRDAKLFINDQPILVGDDGKFREDMTVQAGENNITVRAVNKFDKIATENILIHSDFQEATNDNPSQAGENNNVVISDQKPVEIEIRVDPGPIWLSVEADGNLVFSGTMLTGAMQKFNADQKITINSGKGNATFVKFNGKDIGALSDKDGAVRGVTFTQNTKY